VLWPWATRIARTAQTTNAKIFTLARQNPDTLDWLADLLDANDTAGHTGLKNTWILNTITSLSYAETAMNCAGVQVV
jgi:hypothetical protein